MRGHWAFGWAAAAMLVGQALAAEETVRVGYREVDQLITAEAVVEAVRQSTIAAQVQGRVLELAVKAGDAVRTGQLIARIDARTAEQALAGSQAEVAAARATLANAKSHYERTRQLVAQKFVSQAALDQAESQYRSAQAQVGALEAGVGQAVTQRSFTTITAPYAGLVASTHVEVGDMAVPGREIVTLYEPGKLRVTATLPQSSLAAVKRDAPVRVEVPALEATLTSVAVTILPTADARSHTTKVRLELPAAEGLMPGQFARALFVTGRARRLVIPASAVVRRSEVTAVYAAVEDKPHLRQVRLGETVANGMVEVLAGLREGERVFVDPIRAGASTRIAEGR